MNVSRATKFEVGVVLSGIAAAVISFGVSFQKCDFSWFGRSGALVVMCAVIAEFTNIRVQQFINERATRGAGALGGGVGSLEQPKFRQNWSMITHIVGVLGTLIWGYGDLISL